MKENKNTNMPTQTNQLADEYIRLDFIWNDQFSGKPNRIKGAIKNGDMDDLLYTVSYDELMGDQTNIGIVTTKEEVVNAEITAYENEIRSAFREYANANIGESNTVVASAVVLGKERQRSHRRVRASHPAVHFAINTPNYPDVVTETVLEEYTRSALEKRIDITRAGSGFNMRVREPTISKKEVDGIAGHIVETENSHHQLVRPVYTAPQSGKLPKRLEQQH